MKQRREKAWDVIDRDGLRKRLNELLDRPLGTDDKEFTRMKNGLSNKKDYIFTFLDNPDVPYDNNLSYPNFGIMQVNGLSGRPRPK